MLNIQDIPCLPKGRVFRMYAHITPEELVTLRGDAPEIIYRVCAGTKWEALAVEVINPLKDDNCAHSENVYNDPGWKISTNMDNLPCSLPKP